MKGKFKIKLSKKTKIQILDYLSSRRNCLLEELCLTKLGNYYKEYLTQFICYIDSLMLDIEFLSKV